MATLGLIEYDAASPEVREVYDDIMATRKTDLNRDGADDAWAGWKPSPGPAAGHGAHTRVGFAHPGAVLARALFH